MTLPLLLLAAVASAASDPQSAAYEAAFQLPARQWREAIPVILEACSSPDPRIRLKAAEALAQRSDMYRDDARLKERAARAEGWLLADGDREVRLRAAHALWVMGNREGYEAAIPFLAPHLSSPDPDLRCGAAMALGRIRRVDPEPVPALAACLDMPDTYHPRAAAEVLMGMRTAAREAVPALLRKLKDPDDLLRFSAANAIARIDPSRREIVPVLERAALVKNYGWADEARQALLELRSAESKRSSPCAAPAAGARPSGLLLVEYRHPSSRLLAVRPDGGGARPLFRFPDGKWAIFGLARHPKGALYWLDDHSGIHRTEPGGRGTRRVLALPGANGRGLAIDPAAGKMYWTETPNAGQDGQSSRIRRANLDGSRVETVIEGTGLLGQPALDLDGRALYFGDFAMRQIRRARLDGGEVETVVRENVDSPGEIAVDRSCGRLYWLDGQTTTNYLASVALDGTGFQMIRQPKDCCGWGEVAVDRAAGRVYWTYQIGREAGLWSAALGGGDIRQVHASRDGFHPHGIALEPAPGGVR